MNDFQMDIRTFEQGIILDLQGDLAKNAEESLLKAYPWEQGLEEGKGNLVLNFTQVPYINSAKLLF